MNPRVKHILSYVPSAVFPSIIFPGIFINVDSGGIDIENNPKILASIIAVIVGIFSKNIIATIFAGLTAYWCLIFI
jgi:branched-subunit amino acid transport protein